MISVALAAAMLAREDEWYDPVSETHWELIGLYGDGLTFIGYKIIDDEKVEATQFTFTHYRSY